jgi:hypothetical protein
VPRSSINTPYAFVELPKAVRIRSTPYLGVYSCKMVSKFSQRLEFSLTLSDTQDQLGSIVPHSLANGNPHVAVRYSS